MLPFSLLYTEFLTQILLQLVFSGILQYICDQRRCLSLNFRKEKSLLRKIKAGIFIMLASRPFLLQEAKGLRQQNLERRPQKTPRSATN